MMGRREGGIGTGRVRAAKVWVIGVGDCQEVETHQLRREKKLNETEIILPDR